MRRLLLALLLAPTLLRAAPNPTWKHFRKAKPKSALTAAEKFPPPLVDRLAALPNAPQSIAYIALVRRSPRHGTLLVLGTGTTAPPVGGAIVEQVRLVPPGHAALVRFGAKVPPHVLDSVETATPNLTQWRLASKTDLDADRRVDPVYAWTKDNNRVRRNGALIVRGDTLSLVELGNDARPRAAIDVTLACFAPVAGSGARALIVGRRAIGRSQRAGALDALEALLPGPGGRYVPTAVYGAAFAERAPERSARAAWIKAFRPRPTRISAQTALGHCPGAGLVVYARALRPEAPADLFSVFGPLATEPTAVRAQLKKLKRRVPRAVVILGIGG